MTLSDIIERLEKADGPDRWLDARIDAMFRIGSAKMQDPGYGWAWRKFPTWTHHKQARGMCGVQHDNGDLGLIWDSPYFTGSVEAAIALAEKELPGANRTIRKRYKTTAGKIDGHVYDAHVSGGDICEGETEAIALCLAILKAKQMGVGE